MFPFKTALNTSTIFPFQLDVIQQIEVVKEAGYDGIELWMRDIEDFLEKGRSIEEIKLALDKADLTFINTITFFKWADSDENVRKEAFAQAEREMKLLAYLGCRYIAAPPFGNVNGVSIDDFANYFVKLVHLGRQEGVEPILEFWGKAPKLNTLKEARLIAEKIKDNTKILIDPFHMYVGGSIIEDISQLRGEQIGIVHVNDYPGNMEKEELEDRHRVFPGEGVSPTEELASKLMGIGFSEFLSIELFIEDYPGKSPLEIAQYGLNSMKNAYMVEVDMDKY